MSETLPILAQMSYVAEGLVTAILQENGGDPDYPDVGPDMWADSTRTLVRELSRIDMCGVVLPPAPMRWVEMLRSAEGGPS